MEHVQTEKPRHRCSIVACARWETDHIVEWLTYHGSIGFDHVYLYCNDDDPSALYDVVRPFLSGGNPFVTFLHFAPLGEQRRMYEHFLKTRLLESEWVTFLDIDEFLFLARDPTIDGLLARRAAAADVLYFSWVMFGNSGRAERPAGSVLEQYTRHEGVLHPYTKLIVRTRAVSLDAVRASDKPFWHQWPDTSLRRLNVLGHDMATYYEGFPDHARAIVGQEGMMPAMLGEAVICHFALKSEVDFERRLQRGLAGQFTEQGAWNAEKQLGRHHAILESMNVVEFTALRDHWRRITSRSSIPAAARPGAGINIAVGCQATQSSLCEWSVRPTLEGDAAGAVSGVVTGRYQFHTDEEHAPWWQVDLGGPRSIARMRLYNRMDVAQDRARLFRIDLSDDGVVWREVFRKTSQDDFGGADGAPFQVVLPTPQTGRFVRMTLLTRAYFHLDQIEVYETV